MELAGELAKRLFDVLIAGGARHAKSRVVIFEFNWHALQGQPCEVGLDHSRRPWPDEKLPVPGGSRAGRPRARCGRAARDAI